MNLKFVQNNGVSKNFNSMIRCYSITFNELKKFLKKKIKSY